jgi:hypothetical protein
MRQHRAMFVFFVALKWSIPVASGASFTRRMKLLLKSSSELSTAMDHSVADHVDSPKGQKVTFAPPEEVVAVPNAGDIQSTRRSPADRVWIFLARARVRGRAFKPRLVASKANLGVDVSVWLELSVMGAFTIIKMDL